MRLATPHRVRQQRLQVQVSSPAEALAARLALRSGWGAWVGPALERAFDDLAPPGEIVRLSHLELRLRVRDLDDLSTVLYQQVYEAARAALAEALRSPEARSAPASDDPLGSWLHTGARGWVETAPEIDARARLQAEALATLDTLARRMSDARDPVAWARLIRLLGTGDESPLLQMLQLIYFDIQAEAADGSAGSDPVAETPKAPGQAGHPFDEQDRLNSRADAEATDAHREEPGSAPGPAAPAAQAARRLLDDCVRGTAPLTPYGRMVLAAALLAERAPLTGMDALVSLLAGCPALVWGAPPQAATLRWLEATIGGPPQVQRALPWLALETYAAVLSRSVAELVAAGCAPSPSSVPAPPVLRRGGSGPEPDRAPPGLPLPADSPRPGSGSEPGTPVPLAGLVLLHPYLPRFLGNRGALGDDGKTIAPEQTPRAAALLLALATGRDDPGELDADLVKILLGRDPLDPLPLAAGLVSPEDWEDIDDLLRAVIAHWGALGVTSPDGLRGSYLCRNAMLRRGVTGWSIQVQPAAWDILLGRLPWALAVVRLPWMDAPLHVQWEAA